MIPQSSYRAKDTRMLQFRGPSDYAPPPVVTSWVDPRTGEPSDGPCAPLHADGMAGVERGEHGNPVKGNFGGCSPRKMTEARNRGRKEGRNKIPVEVNGVLYQSQREASRAMRLSDSAVSEIRRRLKPKRGEVVKWQGYEIRWPE